jgi:RHS repeat-associated protein
VTYPEPGLRIAYPYPVSAAYEYDGNGNVEKVTERKQVSVEATAEEVTDPEYDDLGRLATEQRYDGKVVHYAYDLKGNRRKVTDPDGVATEYGYDAQDRLETATTPAGDATYRYHADGLLAGTSYPNGLEEARCYDHAGRLTAIVTARGAVGDACPDVAGMVSRFDYAYDANGNRSLQWERRTAQGSSSIGSVEETRYGYDALDRLVGVAYPDRTVLYQLDAVGNRIGERVRPAPGVLALTVASFIEASGSGLTSDLVATFNRVDWLVSQSDAVDGTRSATYGYDKAGNLTDKVKGGVVRQLRWSYRDTLTAVLQGADATQLVEVGRYDYDEGLQRVKRTTAQEQVEYVLDDRHVLQEASAAAGHPAYRRYHYAGGPLLVEDGAARRFISTDALGSPTDLTSADATVASMRKYDAWGQYRNDTAPVASEPKLGFTGHQYDPETGLVYARARYYDPDLGRFISRDTWEGDLADAPSLHRYAYAYDNPLVYVDPDGNAAYEAAEEWERAQREAAWTGEETMEKVQADSARFANWAAEKLGDSWASRIVGGVVVATAQTVIELTGGLAAVITDPTALIRAPLRLGTGAAEGVEKIERGEYVAGTLAIVADAAAAVETAAGAYAFARNVRVTVEQPRAQSRGIFEVLDPHDGGARRPAAAPSFTAKAPDTAPGAGAPRSWTHFLRKAEERLAQAKANYGEHGLQMNAEAPRRVFYVDQKGVAIPAQPGSVFRGTAVSPAIDEAISQSGFQSGRARGVPGSALPPDAPLIDRVTQYVEGSPFPRDTDFVGFKRYPHDALNTAVRTGRAQLRDPSAFVRLDEVDVSGLRTIDIEKVYSDLGRRPRPPIDVIGELVVEGNVPPSRIRRTYKVRPPRR